VVRRRYRRRNDPHGAAPDSPRQDFAPGSACFRTGPRLRRGPDSWHGITSGPDSTNNILALAFGLLIVFMVVAGSMWIMVDLNQNMRMPSAEPMSMRTF
jgi:hypothetical protein